MKNYVRLKNLLHRRKLRAINRAIVRPGSEHLLKKAVKETNKLT